MIFDTCKLHTTRSGVMQILSKYGGRLFSKTAAILEFYLYFWFCLSVVSGCDFTWAYQISFNSDHPWWGWPPRRPKIYFPFCIWWRHSAAKNVEIYCRPNYGEISQSTPDILLLPVTKNKRPPYWNSVVDFIFVIITGSAVALHCCKAHERINRKRENSTPCKIVTPENFSSKVCTTV